MLYSEIKTQYLDDDIPATSFDVAHPAWRPHLLQGWEADFILVPQLVSKAVDSNYVDSLQHADGKKAMQTSKDLATKEGTFTGTSGGGILSCALDLAKKVPEGSSILALLPDTGERYLSTPLFDDIPADMTEEEKQIAESTHSTPPPPPGLPGILPEAVEFVDKTVAENKVVVWSLEYMYCEFCWTLCKLLDRIKVEYELVPIDAFEFAKDQMGINIAQHSVPKPIALRSLNSLSKENSSAVPPTSALCGKRENCSPSWRKQERKLMTLVATKAILSNFCQSGCRKTH